MAPVRRWPGWDGWVALTATVTLLALWVLHPVGDMGGPVALCAAATAAHLALTWASRRPRPRPCEVPPGIRIVVCIPTHNNASTIADVVERCLAHGRPVLVVDDGSTDGSGTLARKAGATVLTHTTNRGKGAALESALDWAAANGFSHLVTIDADGQHEPDDLPSFFEAIRSDPDVIHAGVRNMDAAPKGARYARTNSNFWVWVSTGLRIGDTQCGFRAYPVCAIRALNLVPSRYQWEVEVLVRAAWAGIGIEDRPCRVYYPPPEERVSSYRKVVDTLRISWLNTHLIAERLLWPPRWFPARRSWRGAHRGQLWGWKLYLFALRRFGRGPVLVALVPLVGFYWLFLGAQRRGLDAYLRRRFPHQGPGERARSRFRLLLNFATSIVDRFYVYHHPHHLTLDRSAVPGLSKQIGSSKGLIVVSSHQGAADFAGVLLGATRSRKVHLLLYGSPGDPYVRLLRELPDPPSLIFVNDATQHASLTAIRALQAGDVVALKGDRPVDPRTARVRFLGDPIRLPTGPYLLASLSGAPIVFLGCFRTGPSTYRFEADGPHVVPRFTKDERDVALRHWAQHFASVMEHWTELYPLQWYNFHDPWESDAGAPDAGGVGRTES